MPRMMKVLVSRPSKLPAQLRSGQRLPDFCWTIDGEVLTPPDIPCADAEVCGCGRSFAGVTSARATSWGVVEMRGSRSIEREVLIGRHLAGWAIVEGFYGHILAGIRDLSERIQELHVGGMVGIRAFGDDRFIVFERSPRYVQTPVNPISPHVQDCEESAPTAVSQRPDPT